MCHEICAHQTTNSVLLSLKKELQSSPIHHQQENLFKTQWFLVSAAEGPHNEARNTGRQTETEYPAFFSSLNPIIHTSLRSLVSLKFSECFRVGFSLAATQAQPEGLAAVR